MPTPAVSSFVKSLRDLSLMEPAQLQEIERGFANNFADPKDLARELVRHNWLTGYQTNQLLRGRGQDLILGSYILMELLGEGGMGQVFKARHRTLDRLCAVKVIRRERVTKPASVQRFLREAKATAKLSHPNIVAVYDADQTNGTYYLAMEYVEGTDLSKLVRTKGPLQPDKACSYLIQAAQGLQHAHEKGLVHRDIKPQNLLIQTNGQVKILDMGLALLTESAQVAELTQEGSIMGTPAYLSPEQGMNAHAADVRSDIYSLGCTFFFALVGRAPFTGATVMQVLTGHLQKDVPSIAPAVKDAPPGLDAVLRRMMSKKPEDRFQTPAEVVAAVQAVVARKAPPTAPIPQKAVATGRAAVLPEPPRGETKRKKTTGADVRLVPTGRRARGSSKLPWVIALVLFLAALGGGGWWYMGYAAQQSKVSQALQYLQGIADPGQFADAAAYLDGLAKAKTQLDELAQSDPATAAHPKVEAARRELLTAETKEKERKPAFQEALKAAQAALLSPEGAKQLDQADELAAFADERKEVQQLRRQRKEKFDQLEGEREQALRARVRKLDEAVIKLEDTPTNSGDSAALLKRIDEQAKEVAKLEEDATKASEDTKKNIRALGERLKALRDKIENSGDDTLRRSALTRALSDSQPVNAYFTAAETYIKRAPGNPLAKDLRKVMGQREAYELAGTWSQLIQPHAGKPLGLSSKEAVQLAGQIRKLKQANPNLPSGPAIETYLKCLDAIAQRMESNPKNATVQFRDIFSGILIKDVWFLRTRDKQRVYYSGQNLVEIVKKAPGGQVNLRYFVAEDGDTKPTVMQSTNVEIVARSPQSVLADEVGKIFPEHFAEKHWDETVLSFLGKIRTSKDIDPILQLDLLRQVLASAKAGSYPLGQTCQSYVDKIDAAKIDLKTRWFDIESDAVVKVRLTAKEFVGKLGPFEKTIKATSDDQQQQIATTIANTALTPVGWLARMPNGRWTVESPVGVPADGDLFALAADSTWQAIGKRVKGKAALDAIGPDLQIEGSLVFGRTGAR